MSNPLESAPDVGPRWYEVVSSDSLRQGDIFIDVLAYWLPDDLPIERDGGSVTPALAVSVQQARANWIVLSASCDIQSRNKSEQVLLAQVLPANKQQLKASDDKELDVRLQVLQRGLFPGRFLLPHHGSEPHLPLSFATYRTQVLLPLAYVRNCCAGPRLRLRPPHREYFGAWAGSHLARVGIEDEDQIRFAGKQTLYPAQILRAVSDAEGA